MTVATVAQAMVCIDAGFHRVVIANQVIGAANIRALADAMRRHEGVDLYCLVDSAESVDHLAKGLAAAAGRTQNLLTCRSEQMRPGLRA